MHPTGQDSRVDRVGMREWLHDELARWSSARYWMAQYLHTPKRVYSKRELPAARMSPLDKLCRRLARRDCRLSSIPR